MKHVLVVAALALALPAFAGDGPPPDKDKGGRSEPDPAAIAAKQADQLKAELKLSDEQAKKVGDILVKNINESLALQKQLRDHERRTHEAIRAVLNDEQKEKLDMMRAHRMMSRGGMRPGAGPNHNGPGDQGGAPPPPPPHDDDQGGGGKE